MLIRKLFTYIGVTICIGVISLYRYNPYQPVRTYPYYGMYFSQRVTNSNSIKTSFTIEEAAAIALLLGIDFTETPFDLNEFWMGVNTELEHGMKYNPTNVTADDPLTTGKIALAHLNEFPDYYKRLKVLEEEAKAYWNK